MNTPGRHLSALAAAKPVIFSTGLVCGIALTALLVYWQAAWLPSLALGAAFAACYSLLGSRRAVWRLVGGTASGGCACAAGMFGKGASLPDSLASGGLISLSALGIVSLFFCIWWLGRKTRSQNS